MGESKSLAPAWRDPWAWLSALAVLPLWLGLRGAPVGEPVAEDFDFLVRALVAPSNPLFDGGGSSAFWRPLSHQLYYETFGNLMLDRPALVAGVHAVLLAAGVVLLYRLLARAFPGSTAAAAASFAVLGESTRTLVAWPSHFIDVGLFLFSMLALHEARAGRRASALAALLAALLCKEVAVVTALLLPFLPGLGGRRERVRWAAWTVGLVALWGAVSWIVRRNAGLEMPHGIAADATSPLARAAWAEWNALRAVFSLSRLPGPNDGPAAALGGVLVVAIAGAALVSHAARARLRAGTPWIAWGLAWFVLGAATLATVHPLWSPNRSQFAGTGLGVGLVTAAAAAHPAAAGLVVGGRLALLALAPPPAPVVTPEPEDRGAFIDVPRLTRLQRLMRLTRGALGERFPALPHGAALAWRNLPLSSEYAFGGAHAVIAWSRDSTLTWDEWGGTDSTRAILTVIEYQPRHAPQIVLLEPAALRALTRAVQGIEQGRWTEALAELDRAEDLQRDRRAAVFLGEVAGRRAYALASLGRLAEAGPEARRAIAAASEDVGARFVLALVHFAAGRTEAAGAELDTLLGHEPEHPEGRELRAVIAGRAEPPRARTTAGGPSPRR